MDTTALKNFAQAARRSLLTLVATKLDSVLAPQSPARREVPTVVQKLEEALSKQGKERLVERVAYIWFNRFCALRFMDVNHYTMPAVVSPAEGQIRPEILAEASSGRIDEAFPYEAKQRIQDLLSGKSTSSDPQGEAYRLLLVSSCNAWGKKMPFLFHAIQDYVELLLPDDLLSEQSILAAVRAAMTEDACQNVEVIGWLYQFYISEQKDAIFRSRSKIAPADIPAATQLFTPDWIVRYLVENSLGRLWMLNHPQSGLAASMPYYIPSETPPTDFLRIEKPEDIRVCDPSCGSGHMLVYAFDLLYQIYEETGYPPTEIPCRILRYNLYGMEIDERAAELAGFALTMKARAKQRSFFKQTEQIVPQICHLHPVSFSDDEIQRYMGFIGHDLFTDGLRTTLRQFEEADNFGSLIRPAVTDAKHMRTLLEQRDASRNMLVYDIQGRVLDVLEMADYLSPKYHVVVTNPPYMGGRGMNARLGAWLKDNYEGSQSDLFAPFILRGLELLKENGFLSMVTMQSWMFLSSFISLRRHILSSNTLLTMAHLGINSFSSLNSKVVSTTAFTLLKNIIPHYRGYYVRLVDDTTEVIKDIHLKEAIANPDCGWFYRASAEDFHKIPGSPVAYWVSEKIRDIFAKNQSLGSVADARQGLATADNNRFLRQWYEVSISRIGFGMKSREEAKESNLKWFPYNKGGDFRKWYGNQDYIVNWENDGQEINDFRPHAVVRNPNYYFKESVSWNLITSATNAFRYYPHGFIFDVAGMSAFYGTSSWKKILLAYSNSIFFKKMAISINPTLNFQIGNFNQLPYAINIWEFPSISYDVEELLGYHKTDWDSYEISWNFQTLPLLNPDVSTDTLEATYANLRTHWQSMTDAVHRLEEENNRIFIEAYGLKDELTPDVPLNEITLTCNPAYRYGGDRTDGERETLLRTDTMKELISYAVGCMFGRYSLDTPGLVLANQGDTLKEYAQRLNERCGWNLPVIDSLDPQGLQAILAERCSFVPDEDNIIPILDDEWFPDDIVARFNTFLQIAFGKEHYIENLRFIEEALGKDIRKYFLKDFYKDHVQRYKRRPIYWLFSSPSGNFNALIYMHRYQPYTVSRVLSHYVRDYREKLSEKVKLFASTQANGEHVNAAAQRNDIRYRNIMAELQKWEDDILYPLSTQRLAIDLDDGVKVNYPKFGSALKKIPGLADKDE